MKQILCEKCGKYFATVHYRQVLNGVKKEMHLCPHCAEKIGLGNESSHGEDWFGSFPLFAQTAGYSAEKKETCPLCGTSLSVVRKSGNFGCSACYDAFAGKLDMTPFVGSGYRAGRLAQKETKESEEPKKEKETAKTPSEELALLREMLKKALETENYEEAARLRDQIRAKEGR